MVPGGAAAYRLRSAVAASSVALGALALVAVTSVLTSLQDITTEGFRRLDPGAILVTPSDQSLVSGKLPQPLTADDARAIARLPHVARAEPVVMLTGMLRACGTRQVVRIVGADDAAVAAEAVVAGRPILRPDVDGRRQTVLLTSDVAARIPCARRLGERVMLSGRTFDLIGEIDAFSVDGASAGTLTAVIPYTTAFQMYGAEDRRLSMLRVHAAAGISPDAAAGAVRDLLRQRHRLQAEHLDDFDIVTRDALLRAARDVSAAIHAGVVGLIAISVFAATLGVFNAMLTSVTERKPEIGLRRSVGATRRQVARQFLIESLALTLAGGIAGVLGGLTVAWPLSVLMDVPYAIDWTTVGLALTACIAAGVAAGTLPAMLAARLNPIDALRHE